MDFKTRRAKRLSQYRDEDLTDDEIEIKREYLNDRRESIKKEKKQTRKIERSENPIKSLKSNIIGLRNNVETIHTQFRSLSGGSRGFAMTKTLYGNEKPTTSNFDPIWGGTSNPKKKRYF